MVLSLIGWAVLIILAGYVSAFAFGMLYGTAFGAWPGDFQAWAFTGFLIVGASCLWLIVYMMMPFELSMK